MGYVASEPDSPARRDAFERGLRELGYVPGQTIIIDSRYWRTPAQLRQVTRELIQLNPNVIFVGPPVAAREAKHATKDIPIVCGSCGDPVENGLVVSLARPGGNVTGLASLSAELMGKRVELLKELLPGVSRVAVFVFPANPGTPPTLKAMEAAGRRLLVEMRRVEIRGMDDYASAFRSAAALGAGAVMLQDDPLNVSARATIAQLALSHRLPLLTGVPDVVEAGALVSYGPDRVDMFRRAASFVDKILKGAKPADLPFEQATKFDLILNVRTAKALGLTIPQSFSLRADRIIE